MNSMKADTNTAIDLKDASEDVLRDLTRRVQDIDNSYRAVAEKMGQLYMCADENKIASLTRRLDKPMRNASENEQMFAGILDELRMQAKQHR